MLLEVATLPKPSQEFKAFCNTLRCPLCGAQLDGNVHPKEARLYCARDNREYKGTWMPGETFPKSEMLMFWYPVHEYEIHSSTSTGHLFNTEIRRYNTGVNPVYRNSSLKVMLQITGPRMLFFRQRMEEELFLKKLKTYQVFS